MPEEEESPRRESSTGGKALGLGVFYQAMGAIASALTDWKLDAVDEELTFGALDTAGQDRLPMLIEHFDMDAALLTGSGVVFVQFKATGDQARPVFGQSEAREIIISAARSYHQHRENSGSILKRFVLATNRREGDAFVALRKRMPALDPSLSENEAIKQFGGLPVVQELWGGNPNKTMRDLAKTLMSSLGSIPEPERTRRVDACLAVMLRYAYAEARFDKIHTTLRKWLREWGFFEAEYEPTASKLVGLLNQKGGGAQAITPDQLMREHLGNPLALPLTLKHLAPEATRRLKGGFDSEPPTPADTNPLAFEPWMVSRRSERGLAIEALSKADSRYRLIAFVGNGGTGKTRLMQQTLRAVQGLDPEGDEDAPVSGEWGPCLSLIMTRDRLSIHNVGEAIRTLSKHGGAYDYSERRLAVANGKGQDGYILCLAIDGLDEISESELQQVLASVASYIDDRQTVRIVVTCREAQWDRLRRNGTLTALSLPVKVEEFDESVALRQFNLALGFDYNSPVTGTGPISGVTQSSVGSFEATMDPMIYNGIQHPLLFGSIKAFGDEGGAEAIRLACEGDDEGRRIVARRFMRDFCVRVWKRILKNNVSPGDVFYALQALAKGLPDPVLASWAHWEDACGPTPAFGSKGDILFYQCAASGFILDERPHPAFRWRHAFVGAALVDMEEPQWP